jgi:two-component system response regulator HydG
MTMPDNHPLSSSLNKPDGREPAHLEAVTVAPSGLLVGVSRPDGLSPGYHRLPEGMPTLRLLVVDDDAPLRKACCEIALGMGFVTLSAGSVQEALAVLQQQPVEMLLLDLKLPGGGGLKLLGEVMALYPSRRRWRRCALARAIT